MNEREWERRRKRKNNQVSITINDKNGERKGEKKINRNSIYKRIHGNKERKPSGSHFTSRKPLDINYAVTTRWLRQDMRVECMNGFLTCVFENSP